ncbi:hypothetical protein EVAR_33534_1 [Eumeta japonica]|uniref:Secreted protein n=1 Tax=Eumeta variegata TaxID=151549 RepID=A0A4C1VLY5_EUMVA|nr:hypothetical protein EVAR_33534_1 [Eumeta japonica]
MSQTFFVLFALTRLTCARREALSTRRFEPIEFTTSIDLLTWRFKDLHLVILWVGLSLKGTGGIVNLRALQKPLTRVDGVPNFDG